MQGQPSQMFFFIIWENLSHVETFVSQKCVSEKKIIWLLFYCLSIICKIVLRCYQDCAHGTCSGPPDFQCLCDVGWTGVECNTDCGCHGHSTCQSGVGICDECQDYTTGDNCEFCTLGAHGDATAAGKVTLNMFNCLKRTHTNMNLQLISFLNIKMI